ncbi:MULTISPECIES: DUF3592 domain-containing protein [Hymenobacter]|uniref:DUF3592 domain-containing protein n=1 Tax=Hymenobacter luteus TaxID=1411122 RepID=UPI003CCDA617
MALALLLLGGLFLLKARRLQQRLQHLLDHGLETTATIIRLEENPTTDHRTFYPVLRFQTTKKQTITASYPHSRERRNFRVGDKLLVRYDATSPAQFLVPTFVASDMRIYQILGYGAGSGGILLALAAIV